MLIYAIDDETSEKMFVICHQMLTEAGYVHYEVSNYALPGFEAKHNSSYWNGTPYVGVGPSASGFLNGKRYKNISNFEGYISNIKKGLSVIAEEDELTNKQKYEEYIFLGLRTNKGISISEIRDKFNVDFVNTKGDIIRKMVEENLLTPTEDRLIPTVKGFLLNDQLAINLI